MQLIRLQIFLELKITLKSETGNLKDFMIGSMNRSNPPPCQVLIDSAPFFT